MVPDIEKLLDATIGNGASDLHLNVGHKPMVRLHGKLTGLDTKVLEPEDTASLMRSVTPADLQAVLSSEGSVDFGFSFKQGQARFRVNVSLEQGHNKLTLRRLPSTLLSAEEIGLPRQMLGLIRRARGLILVTGPTGSGKTTTLAALASVLIQEGGKHIFAIEEPTEYVLPKNERSLVTQREVPTDVRTFHAGLRSALRSDPDVILVGEMRDPETTQTAISAAETGHLVMATAHTTSASGTVNRIIDQFDGASKAAVRAQLSLSLVGVLCQQLVPRKDGKGRVAAFEFLIMRPDVRNLIRDDKIHRIDNVIQTSRKAGMQLLDEHLAQLVEGGVVDLKDAVEKANDPAALYAKFPRDE